MDRMLVLRDIHLAQAPSWWPPAPGWWLLAGVFVAGLGLWAWRRQRRRHHRARMLAVFDEAVAAAASPSQAVAAMSELLRRAARRLDPQADRLEGDAWLALLDRGLNQPVFDTPEGRLLLDGAFRPDVDARHVEALRRIARARFIAWMATR
jgi:hypothetical protein